MPFPEHDEMVEAFLTERLDESLHEGARIGRTKGSLLDPQASILQGRIKADGELGVAIVHHDVGADTRSLSVLHKRLGVFANPDFVWVVGRDQLMDGLTQLGT